jgi:hypothetical protein
MKIDKLKCFALGIITMLALPVLKAAPTLGAHELTYYPYGTTGPNPLVTPAMNTQATGSTLLACVARGKKVNFDPLSSRPTDNKSNGWYSALSIVHPYTGWANSGTQLFGVADAKGGTLHVVQTAFPDSDEITMAAVEIRNGGLIKDAKWNQVAKGSPLTSQSVTTTGPATLVAFWWGDGDVNVPHAAVPNNGFVVIDSLLSQGALIQCAVATKNVTAAGTYNVTWNSNGLEGAQLYLVAVQTGAASVPFVTGQTLSPTAQNNYGGWVGFKFTVGGSAMTVTELARWVRSGNTGTHTVKIVNASNGLDVAGASVSVVTSGAPAGAFKYTPLAQPVVLPANTAYYLVSRETVGGDYFYSPATVLQHATKAVINSAAFGSGTATGWATYGTTDKSYGPVSLKHQ